MLVSITFCLAAMIAPLANASPMPLDRVTSHTGKDCTGDALVATYLYKKGSLAHCFKTAGQSLQNLHALTTTCSRGFVIAFEFDDCNDPDNGFLFKETVGGSAEGCHNVPTGYKSFQLGCVF